MNDLKVFIVIRRLLNEDFMITFVNEKIRKKMMKKEKLYMSF
jgi:hypothetical protein